MKTNEKDTKQGVVPALRFPEFRKNEEWNIPHLRQISTRIITRVGNSKLLPVSISAGVGFLPQTEKFGRDISGEQYRNYIILNRGEFAYNKGNSKKYPQGCVCRLEEFDRVAAPNTFLCFRFNDNVIPDFFKGYFDSNYHGKQLQNVITSGARSNGLLNISADEFFNIILPTPKDKEEQQKIAECLSSIDALIKAAENKIDELKAHKKGLMQQLFPAEGKSVPALRFPEFQNAGEWKPYKLNDFGSFFRGLTYSTADVSNDNDGIGVLRSTNIQNNRLILDKDLVFVNKTCTSEQRLQKGDVVICMSNGSKALVGKNAELDQDISYNLTVGAFCSIFRPKNVFAKYLLQTDSYTKFVALAIGGGNINNLKNSDLENFVQFAPAKSEEQQKIADCLSSIDNLIIAQTNRLEALKAHKKGLMQQLFPNLNNHKE
ncbi:restriction endonuclease subunit S [uncultured Alistipes sp.]|uniref:restriction endonuclease subunit S n=3 Tax=uncultured Alistipes sp. TaxID=538949 RepID=UPI00264A2070|nr:restriction endonuclease subunit S [uncultured Alistipes sp.]